MGRILKSLCRWLTRVTYGNRLVDADPDTRDRGRALVWACMARSDLRPSDGEDMIHIERGDAATRPEQAQAECGEEV